MGTGQSPALLVEVRLRHLVQHPHLLLRLHRRQRNPSSDVNVLSVPALFLLARTPTTYAVVENELAGKRAQKMMMNPSIAVVTSVMLGLGAADDLKTLRMIMTEKEKRTKFYIYWKRLSTQLLKQCLLKGYLKEKKYFYCFDSISNTQDIV